LEFPLPPAIVFHGPIEVVVIPDTYIYDVYAVPDIEVDIFFSRGWWWRPWEGRWYRSRYHDRGWVYYRYIPDFYYDIDLVGEDTIETAIGAGIDGTTDGFPANSLNKLEKLEQP
jgi:hypothetical protein